MVAVPTNITPLDGATLLENTPLLGATVVADGGLRARVEWQLATNNTFSTNLRTVTEGTSDLRLSGSTTERVPLGQALSQNTWYLRARQIDENGSPGAWSATTSFLVSHKPSAIIQTPSQGNVTQFAATIPFTWIFSDPSSDDAQSAYQIIVERNSDGAVVTDTGKVASTAHTGLVAINTSYKEVMLRWRIRVWDSDNVAGDYSTYGLFRVSDPPSVTIVTPADSASNIVGKPNVQWTLDSSTQRSYRVKFFRTSDNVQAYDSGVVTSAATIHTPNATVLANSVQYRMELTVTDVDGLSSTVTSTFTTNYDAPSLASYTVDADDYSTAGYVLIDWSNMNADGQFTEWRVYRRKLGELAWTRVFATGDVTTRQFKDWTGASQQYYQWSVTQVALRSGVPSESALESAPQTFLLQSDQYWLISTKRSDLNIMVENVTADSYSVQVEREVLVIVDRGNKVNYGTQLGLSGSISCQVRGDNPRIAKLKIEALGLDPAPVYLRDPFGSVTLIDFFEPSITRVAGVGLNEYVDVTASYQEVAE